MQNHPAPDGQIWIAISSSDNREAEQTVLVARITRRFPARQDSLLPLLHALQEELGHVPDAAVPPIAKALNLSRAMCTGGG